MHEALVGAGGERVRAHGGDGGFRGHAGVADAVGAGHLRELEAGGDVLGQADFLVDLHGVAEAHHAQVGTYARQGRAGGFDLVASQVENCMGILYALGDRSVDCGAQVLREAHEILGGSGRLDSDLRTAGGAGSVDGDPGAVRTAIGHGNQHFRQECAELRFHRPVL